MGTRIHDVCVNAGNRNRSIAAVTLLGMFAAADAGRVGEDGTGAVWVAPELLEALNAAAFPACIRDVVIQAGLESDSNGRVAFEWHPATGELSFAADGIKPAVTLPEELSPASAIAAAQDCGSR